MNLKIQRFHLQGRSRKANSGHWQWKWPMATKGK